MLLKFECPNNDQTVIHDYDWKNVVNHRNWNSESTLTIYAYTVCGLGWTRRVKLLGEEVVQVTKNLGRTSSPDEKGYRGVTAEMDITANKFEVDGRTIYIVPVGRHAYGKFEVDFYAAVGE